MPLVTTRGYPTYKGNPMNLLKRFLKDEAGVTALEYGLIAACVAVAIIVSVQALGTNVAGTFAKVSAAMTGA